MAKITPFLCVDVQAKEATRIYTFRPGAEAEGLQLTDRSVRICEVSMAFSHIESLLITMKLGILSRWHNSEALLKPMPHEKSTRIQTQPADFIPPLARPRDRWITKEVAP